MKWPEFIQWMRNMGEAGWEIEGLTGEGVDPEVQNWKLKLVRRK